MFANIRFAICIFIEKFIVTFCWFQRAYCHFVIILFIYLFNDVQAHKKKTKEQRQNDNADVLSGVPIKIQNVLDFKSQSRMLLSSSCGPFRGYLAKSEVLPHVRDSNQRWLINMGGFGSYLGAACTFDIRLYLTPLVQARQFIETCGT